MRDWNAVLTKEIPSRAVRRRKMFCGGHSLGGPLTMAYAGWDFDGNPATTADAGYEQCAGFFGLDTSLGTGGGDASPAGPATALAAASAGAPFVSAPPFTPETLQVPGALGVAAFHQRGQTQAIKQLPHSDEHRPLPARAVLARRGPLRHRQPEHPRLQHHQRGRARRHLRRQLQPDHHPARQHRQRGGRAAGGQELPVAGVQRAVVGAHRQRLPVAPERAPGPAVPLAQLRRPRRQGRSADGAQRARRSPTPRRRAR